MEKYGCNYKVLWLNEMTIKNVEAITFVVKQPNNFTGIYLISLPKIPVCERHLMQLLVEFSYSGNSFLRRRHLRQKTNSRYETLYIILLVSLRYIVL